MSLFIKERLEYSIIKIEKASFSSVNDIINGFTYLPLNTGFDIFTDLMTSMLEQMKTENKDCHLMGNCVLISLH